MKPLLKPRAFIFIVLIVSAVLITACNGIALQETGRSYVLAPLEKMPEAVRQAPPTVQEAYQFAVANPDVANQIPCYCGCGAMGHTSNLSCFVADADTSSELAFDEHALGCSICVDIAQDTMRLMDEGKSVNEIFTYVDNTYARFGPPTNTQ